jgi:Peptidase inhibitor I9.
MHLAWTAFLPLALAAPVIQPHSFNLQLIPERYIVKLRDGVSEAALEKAIKEAEPAGPPQQVYRAKRFKGFAGRLTPKVLEKVKSLPEVST